ncbi:glycosyltransferase [Nocardioides euryhalodurans]|uniref:Glycosyltransferase n=1 Tax=Nocardioides euryhalodurans TaxID=2518370 RepID=A0A4P7GJB8_9ACTN|nr:glycosyltransferase [Nocardioides euryhalodurans]QBR92100.1 glycosyltransferase [Nocardioides euryhalodurans]
MRLALVTSGTRGDAQPLILLARELLERGHEPVLGLPPNLVALGEQAGLTTHALGPDTQQLVESEQGRAWLAAGDSKSFMKELSELSSRASEATTAGLLAACERAELVVAGVLMQDLALPLAEARGIPMVAVHSFPFDANRRYPNLFMTNRRLPGPLNLVSGKLFERVWWQGFSQEINAFRASVGLEATSVPTARQMARDGRVAIQAYDPLLTPGLAEAYGERRPLVGFLAPDGGFRDKLGEAGLPAPLADWLGDGEPPVFFGFGSMPVHDPDAAVTLITEVARRLEVRAVVNAGWGGLAALDPDGTDVTVVGQVDHDALLPRCRAAVHHGGAGTTYASLAAGVPTVVCSVFADQPFWGARLEELGLGATLRFADLDADRLEGALRRALDPAVAGRAAAVGGELRARPSATSRAVDIIEAALAG